MFDEIIKLRKELHQNPELSGHEAKTANRIKSFLGIYPPSEIIENLGGHGFATTYQFSRNGPTIAFRCELDALPIDEENQFIHRSKTKGVSHKCGHDGHMAIIAGLLFWIKKQSFKTGKIVLLFQSAEETGQGAFQMLNDDRFTQLNIDYIFALHNIPGEKMHSILVMDYGFSAEVQSFSVRLEGKESHASEPEYGINPATGIAEIITAIAELNRSDPQSPDFAVLTPVYINMGQKAYGISSANGELHYTIRTWSSEKMAALKSAVKQRVEKICAFNTLKHKFEWFEYFPAARNNEACNEVVKKAAESNQLKIIDRPYPFKFGEDFGWFSKNYKTSMFGLGAGIDTPALHNATYDFPDVIIETGIDMFKAIITLILQNNNKL